MKQTVHSLAKGIRNFDEGRETRTFSPKKKKRKKRGGYANRKKYCKANCVKSPNFIRKEPIPPLQTVVDGS